MKLDAVRPRPGSATRPAVHEVSHLIVEEIMTRSLITVTPETTVAEARELTRQHRIRHLPVLHDGTLTGIISDRDLREAGATCGGEASQSIGRFIKTAVITTHPLEQIGEAAYLMAENKIGCLPVVQNNHLIGIVTETDLLRQLVSLLGVDRPGSQIEVAVPDEPGTLAAVADVIRMHRTNIVSVLTPPRKDPGRRRLVFRIATIDPRKIIADLDTQGYEVRWAAPRLED